MGGVVLVEHPVRGHRGAHQHSGRHLQRSARPQGEGDCVGGVHPDPHLCSEHQLRAKG